MEEIILNHSQSSLPSTDVFSFAGEKAALQPRASANQDGSVRRHPNAR